MPSPGKLVFQNGQLTVSGDWTLPNYGRLKRDVQKATAMEVPNGHSVDLATINALDTAGASLLVDLLGARQLHELSELTPGLSSERQELLRLVANAMASPEGEKSLHSNPITEFLAGVGEKIEDFWHQQRLLIGFTGQILATLASILATPWRWRITSLVAHVHQTGLNALPIVALLTFLVGAVVAFLGATVLDDFGATIYTVNLVAFSFLREFGVLLAAILLAGRTASAFTAHIGAMKVNEELDAIRTLGLNPIELLVLPRVMAMMVSLPILTFVGMISGMVGGAMVCALVLDITPTQFMAIVEIGRAHV